MTLTALEIKNAKQGMFADGNGLYLRVQPNGAKSWIFRYQIDARRREMGLGSLSAKSAIDARGEVALLRKQIASGIDPIDHRREGVLAEARAKATANVTFRDVALEYIESHQPSWRNAKHGQQWRNTLETYAFPKLGDLQPGAITTDHILSVLKPIWKTKTETAARVRSRMELVLAFAKAKKLRSGENPAIWRGHLDALLPKPGKIAPAEHHPALPYSKMSAFMRALRAKRGQGARALEFAILTGSRSGEVRGMLWREVDWASGVWTIPASRMKAGRIHRVPLSSRALELLDDRPKGVANELVFPGERSGRPLSDMTLSAIIKRMTPSSEWIDVRSGKLATPHGFRSSFRDWVAERTDFPHEMAEIALAHTIDNKVEAAYRRGDMLEKRREMMEAWCGWCAAK